MELPYYVIVLEFMNKIDYWKKHQIIFWTLKSHKDYRSALQILHELKTSKENWPCTINSNMGHFEKHAIRSF